MNNIKFIVYQTYYDSPEVLVTTPELEKEFIHQWFEGTGRMIEEYDRTEHDETCIRIRNLGLRVM
jgi:hypothetical protein